MIDFQAATDAAAQSVNTTVTSQIGAAALIGYFLSWLKRSRLVPWIGSHTKYLNYILTGILAFVTSIGIHYTFDPTAGTLVIGGLHASTLVHGTWDWLVQWGMTQMASDNVQTKLMAENVITGNVERPTGIKLAVDAKP